MPGQHRAGEVVEAPRARLAPVALPAPLHVVATVPDHRAAVASRTMDAIGPAVLAHQREALGVIHQSREVDQIRCSHGGGRSSRGGPARAVLTHHHKGAAAPLPKPESTTPDPNKSHQLYGFSAGVKNPGRRG